MKRAACGVKSWRFVIFSHVRFEPIDRTGRSERAIVELDDFACGGFDRDGLSAVEDLQ